MVVRRNGPMLFHHQLERSADNILVFVSLVSDEFRTPLGIIQSSAELLRDHYERMPPAERSEHLESIARNTGRMAEILEDILTLSRLEAGHAGNLDFPPCGLELKGSCCRVVAEVLSP